jgi:hypothetical protein
VCRCNAHDVAVALLCIGRCSYGILVEVKHKLLFIITKDRDADLTFSEFIQVRSGAKQNHFGTVRYSSIFEYIRKANCSQPLTNLGNLFSIGLGR